MILVFLGKFILFILASLIVYLIFALLGTIIPINIRYHNKKDGVDCYLCSDGIHTDFVVPSQNQYFDWTQILNPSDYQQGLDEGSFLGIGWGDRGFYLDIPTWNDLTLKVAARAMLIPSASLMHIIAYKELPTEKKKLVNLKLSKEEYLELCAFITSYFKHDSKDQVIHLPGVGYTPNDNFYASKASYHALHTCNYWINKGLIKSGVRTALWSPTDIGIFWHLRSIA